MTAPIVRPPPKPGPGGFGGRLRLLRRERGLLQRQLAKLIKVNQCSLSKWESGELYPTFWNLIEIAEFFKADIAWLTGMQAGYNDGGSRYDRHQPDAR